MQIKISLKKTFIAMLSGIIVSGFLSIFLNIIWFDMEEAKATQKAFLTEIRYLNISGNVIEYDVEKGVKFQPYKKKTKLKLVIERNIDKDVLDTILYSDDWRKSIKEVEKSAYIKNDILMTVEERENRYFISMEYI